MMYVIVGLGNPGTEYEGTRHNVGREVLEHFANVQCGMANGKWRERKPLHAEMLECDIAGHPVLLAKPTTYMNESGKAVAALIRSYRLSAIGYRLAIVHDDLDLPLGTLRLSQGGSSGGQKGVQSIIDALGTEDFLRLRVGIGPNTTPDGHRIPAEKFVLEKFRKEERNQIDAAIQRAVATITVLLRDGLASAQRAAHQ